MKNLTIILSAGVIVGLLVYATLDWYGALGLMVGDLMTMRINTFVVTLASVGFGSSGLALVFRWGLGRGDREILQDLQMRIARLESNAPPGGGHP